MEIMSKKEKDAIYKTEEQYFDKKEEITTKCPRCGSVMEINFYGGSYVVKCSKRCIKASYYGI